MKRLASWIVPAVLLAGCAVGPQVHEVPGIEKSAAVVVSDVRPPTEKERTLFSYLITSEAYGIFRVGDGVIEPPGPRVLTHRLNERLGQNGAMPDLTIRHFVVYENSQSAMRSSAAGASFGVIGAVIAGSGTVTPGEVRNAAFDPSLFEAIAGENEYKRGLFAEGESPGRMAAWMVYINTATGGREVFTRSMVPTRSVEGRPRTMVEAIKTAIDYHVSNY